MNWTFENLDGRPQHDRVSDYHETMTDVIDQDGRILEVNLFQAKTLGLAQASLLGSPLEKIYDEASIQRIRKAFTDLKPSQTRILPTLQLIRGDGVTVEVCALVRMEEYHADGCIVLRTDKTDQLLFAHELSELRHQHMILKDFFSNAQDACWCIEYLDPVDLEAPDSEIIRQIFENSSRWAACNPAMEKMYGLPEGLAFSDQGIKVYFPRNAENEKFVTLLIESGFSIINAQATDLHHDGTPMYVENDVEAFIENAKLHRMWGIVRDVSERTEHDRDINKQYVIMSNILDAMPFPLMIVDSAQLIEAVNPALEEMSFLPAGDLLNKPASQLFKYPEEIEMIWQEFERGINNVKVNADILDGKNSSIKLQVLTNIIEEIEGGVRYLMIFVPLLNTTK